MPKRILITQSNYIPWKGYFDNISQCDEMVIYDDVQYTRRDWRNRNLIKTPQGLQWLSIPVEVKGKYHQKINETIVADNTWKEKHLKSIEQNYRKAPFFHEYFDQIQDWYELQEENLSKINLHLIERLNALLGIHSGILRSDEFDLKEDRTERLIDICVQREADEYLTGPAAREYMNEDAFKRSGIKVIYADYSTYRPYPQLYGDFQHGVSILDAIFNVGADLKKILYSTS